MALLEAEKTGKASAAIWKQVEGEKKTGQKFAAGDDLIIPSGVEVKWNTATKPRSLKGEGTYTLAYESGPIELGASTANASNTILSLPASGTVSGNPLFNFGSTAASAVKVALGGHAVGAITASGAGKYEVTENFGSSGKVKVEESVLEWVMVGRTCEATEWQLTPKAGATPGSLENSTLKATGSTFGSFRIRENMTTTGLTVEIASGGLGIQKIGWAGVEVPATKILAGELVEVEAARGLGNVTLAAGATLTIKPAAKPKVTGWTINGTAAEPSKLETAKAGEKAQVEMTAGNHHTNYGVLVVNEIELVEASAVLYVGKATGTEVKASSANIKAEEEGALVAVHGGGRISLFGGAVRASSPTIHGGGQTMVTGSHVSAAVITVHGGGSTAVTGSRVSASSPAVHGGGLTTIVGSHISASSPTVHGGGNVTLVGAAAPEEEEPPVIEANVAVTGGGAISLAAFAPRGSSLLVHGGGATTVVGSKVSASSPAVHGGGRAAIVGSKVSAASVPVHGGGQVTLVAAAAVGRPLQTHGGGRVTVSSSVVPAGAISVHGGGRTQLTGYQQPSASTIIHGGGSVVIAGHVVGYQRVAVTGGGRTTASGYQQPTSSPAIHGGGRTTVAGQTGRLPVRVHGGGQTRVLGYQRPTSTPTVHGGGRVTLVTPPPERQHPVEVQISLALVYRARTAGAVVYEASTMGGLVYTASTTLQGTLVEGQLLELQTTFTQKTGPFSPHSVRYKVKTPRRERRVNNSPANPTPGVYTEVVGLNQAGDWTYRVEALNEAGEVVAADQGSFPVEPAAV